MLCLSGFELYSLWYFITRVLDVTWADIPSVTNNPVIFVMFS